MELRGPLTCLALDDSRGLPGSLISGSAEKEHAPETSKILVVDDEKLLADTTAAILRVMGYKTKTANDGFSALEIARAYLPDYLLTDVMMPNMNGVQLAMAVARIFPATKILLFSGQAGIADMLDEGRAHGFDFPLLAKPVHPTQLIEALKALKDR